MQTRPLFRLALRHPKLIRLQPKDKIYILGLSNQRRNLERFISQMQRDRFMEQEFRGLVKEKLKSR